MARPPDDRSLENVSSILARLLDARPERSRAARGTWPSADLRLDAPGVAYLVKWKPVGDAAGVGSAIRELASPQRTPGRQGHAKSLVPIVAVPFMGETGRRLCEEAGVSWVDLSGNAWIEAPGKRVRFVGHRNRFASVGRPADVFAPRSSRVMRALVMEPTRAFTQGELAETSGVDKGRVSRLVRRLEAMNLVIRDARALRLKDPSLALQAWREAYSFEKHDVRRGHVAVRDPQELISAIRGAAESSGVSWSLTGLAAAWQMTHFAMFRLVTVFVRERPPDEWLDRIGFREEPRGANLWIVRPVDDGVFVGSDDVDGVPCVHAVQAYLDLKAHPERAEEAAAELLARVVRRAGE